MREIFKAFFKMGSGTVVSLLLGAVAMKIVAVVLGPSGMGLYSLLRQILEFATRGGDAGNTAVVQGLASRKGQARDTYLITTFWVFVSIAFLVFVVLLVLAPWVALWVFGDNDEQTINLVRWLALPIVLTTAFFYLDGILNSFRAIGLLVLLGVLGIAAMALLAYPVSKLVEAGYTVAFICMLSAPPAVGVALGTWSAVRAGWLTPLSHGLRAGFHSSSLRHFFSLAGTLFITGSVGGAVFLAIRALIAQQEGLASAGLFAAAWALGSTYVGLYLNPFGTYYLPILSQAGDPSERTMLMRRTMRLTTLFMAPMVMSVIVLKPLALELLYSSEFLPSLEILRWMLIGDYFKIPVWVISIQMMAYADVRVLLWESLLSSLGFLAFTLIALFGFSSMEGIGVGFFLVYVIELAFYLYYTRSRYDFSLAKSVVVPWLLGLALITGASWHTWSDTKVDWFTVLLWIGAAIILSWASLSQSERREMLLMLLRRNETQR
jgi:O-antigen/teichoic acid export membrane protein